MALGVISFIVFPQYLGYYYKKHFSKIIKTEDYKNRIDQSFNISFNNEFIEVKNNHIQAKHNVGNFEYISETNEYFFIKLKAGDFLAYPKEQINDFDTLKTYFKNICTKNKIEYKNEYGWKWK
ncbi:hypothetical protein [Flavobacterium phragmitis]|nr:hypothetical protein [Flavobacterium phragmitis]